MTFLTWAMELTEVAMGAGLLVMITLTEMWGCMDFP